MERNFLPLPLGIAPQKVKRCFSLKSGGKVAVKRFKKHTRYGLEANLPLKPQ
jgi:hypothetical protein